MGESASDILRRLLNLSSSTLLSRQPDEAPVAAVPPKEAAPTAGQNEKVASSSQVEEEPIKVITKKQPEEAIEKVVGKVRQLLASEDFLQESKAVVRFLELLKVLYRTNPESFAQATESLQGRTRVYFARDEATLLAAGNHTKPKQIPDTPYWVITNTNSGRKMLMLEGAMQSMHLPQDLIDEVRSFFIAN
ncbi:replication initiation negative regulator SeqA [Conservatibacter flavescens]|uniref:replication initiation negative regulator SeqA n=1 Tax=Conservatibacter flavescens TaxID=28161 RepID=UPI003C2B38C4